MTGLPVSGRCFGIAFVLKNPPVHDGQAGFPFPGL
jgi:hypothetical protein